ncbi:MAG: hypothetical protein WCR45_04705 [Bacteroidaceae bacterium]|nr:hypothetical protein [Bacteroidaceae bacterium]
MRTYTLLFFLLFGLISRISAQRSYFVTTPDSQHIGKSQEETFLNTYFPLVLLCQWKPGMRFIYLPSYADRYISTFRSYDTDQEADNGPLIFKTFEFLGTEERSFNITDGITYSTRFIFSCEGKKYYYENNDGRLDEICIKNPRATIRGLVYLRDVDTARKLLLGKTIFIQGMMARVDDKYNFSGYKVVPIPENLKATITAIGVGSQEYPVKIIFKDEKGHYYYKEVAMSKTNSGMDMVNFQSDKKDNYFLNAFNFTDKNPTGEEAAKRMYLGMQVYPKINMDLVQNSYIEGKKSIMHIHIFRYTPFTITDIKVKTPSTLAQLTLKDKEGNLYLVNADLKYDVIIKNDNYIRDMFAFGDIRKEYPYISEEEWELIAQGDVKIGMTTDECKLAKGSPVQIRLKPNSHTETWYYGPITLEFQNSRLSRIR